jgi:short-subunit dehydrogenase
MVGQGQGKVLVTGSIAGWMPGSFAAVYNGTKAFVDNFTAAIRNELKEHEGITITTLEPGPVETNFFHRAGMDDTKVGQSESKSDPADVAKHGWDALMAGKSTIISGVMNKLQVAAAGVLPQSVPAEMHRDMAEPGSGKE